MSTNRKPEHVRLARTIMQEFEEQDAIAWIGEIIAALEAKQTSVTFGRCDKFDLPFINIRDTGGEVHIVTDRFDSNHRLPFVGIFDNHEQAYDLVKKLNINGPVMRQSGAGYNTYPMNAVHPRAFIPKQP